MKSMESPPPGTPPPEGPMPSQPSVSGGSGGVPSSPSSMRRGGEITSGVPSSPSSMRRGGGSSGVPRVSPASGGEVPEGAQSVGQGEGDAAADGVPRPADGVPSPADGVPRPGDGVPSPADGVPRPRKNSRVVRFEGNMDARSNDIIPLSLANDIIPHRSNDIIPLRSNRSNDVIPLRSNDVVPPGRRGGGGVPVPGAAAQRGQVEGSSPMVARRKEGGEESKVGRSQSEDSGRGDEEWDFPFAEGGTPVAFSEGSAKVQRKAYQGTGSRGYERMPLLREEGESGAKEGGKGLQKGIKVDEDEAVGSLNQVNRRKAKARAKWGSLLKSISNNNNNSNKGELTRAQARWAMLRDNLEEVTAKMQEDLQGQAAFMKEEKQKEEAQREEERQREQQKQKEEKPKDNVGGFVPAILAPPRRAAKHFSVVFNKPLGGGGGVPWGDQGAKAGAKPSTGPPRPPGKRGGASVILCMDPNCNSCPPEMHMHMHMRKAPEVPSAASVTKKRFKLEDLDLFESDEEDDDDPDSKQMRVTVNLCGYKLSFNSEMQFLPPVFNPHNKYVKTWTRLLLVVLLFGFFLDPFFLYVLSFSYTWYCVYNKWAFLYTLVAIRSFLDLLTLANMVLFSRLAFKATQAHVRKGNIRNSWGELVKVGELVVDDRKAIFLNYCNQFLLLDILCFVPWPQIVYMAILPMFPPADVANTWIVLLRLSGLLQCIPRLLRTFPMVSGTSGYHVFENAWSSFILNLFAFSTMSHMIGAIWFLLTQQRVSWCLDTVCDSLGELYCRYSYLSCPNNTPPSSWRQKQWINSAVGRQCYNGSSPVALGIYVNGVQAVYLSGWFQQWLYSIMWGLQQVSTFGGNLVATTTYGEVLFMIMLVAVGLFLFALLIGNMQNFLMALSRRMQEHQLQMRDTELWIEQRNIPRPIAERIKQLGRYVWTTNEGVDEEAIMSTFTEDIQRDVRRHLFLQPIKKCQLLAAMDNTVQDAICERLKSQQYIDDTEIIREGAPVARMFFVVRGALESVTTNKGRTGFYERVILGKGDILGEELLVYFIEKYAGEGQGSKRRGSFRRDPKFQSSVLRDALPRSERTIRCLGPVNGFSLAAEDIDYVCTQFHTDMQGDRVQRALNMISQSRRTKAATTVQVWWRASMRRRHDIPFDVMLQAIRMRRFGALIKSANKTDGEGSDEESGSFSLPRRLNNKKTPPSNGGSTESSTESPGVLKKPSQKVGWFGARANSGDAGEQEDDDEIEEGSVRGAGFMWNLKKLRSMGSQKPSNSGGNSGPLHSSASRASKPTKEAKNELDLLAELDDVDSD